MATKVLVIDDKLGLRSMVKNYLEQAGIAVVEAADGREGLIVARHEHPDLIILDLMMPELGGYDFIRAHKREANTPIIILTAKIEESDRVLGLELGADDYMTKPFSLREMMARMHAVLRRSGRAESGSDQIRYEHILLDKAGHIVRVNDHTVDLTPSEFDLLTALMASPGRVFTRNVLTECLQASDLYEGVERTIDVHIHNLRAKIEPDPANPRFIETVYGVGYRFAAKD